MKILLAITLILASPVINAQEAKSETPAEVLKGEKALKGYWVPDPDALYEMILENAAQAIEAGLVTKEALKSQASEFAKGMLIHFSGDAKTAMYSEKGKEEGTYKITAKRPEKNEIDIEIVTKASGTEKSTLVVEGDALVMTAESGGGTFKLQRISGKDAPDRIAAIAKLKK